MKYQAINLRKNWNGSMSPGPRGVVNTGDAGGELTAENDRWI